MSQLLMKFFLCALVVAGIFLIAFGSYDYLKLHQARYWPEVSAIIDSSSMYCWRGGHGAEPCTLRIEYTYLVDGHLLRGHTVQFGHNVLDQSEAFELTQRFTEGKKVVAYVNPNDHQDAVLDRGHVTGQVKWAIASGLGAVLAGIILLLALR